MKNSLCLFIGQLLIIILLMSRCASERPSGKTEAEVLYKEALEMVDAERYLLAQERLNLLRSKHPYSYYSTHAELLLADILFLQESYVESAAAYQLFRDFHPKHEKIPYVIWKLAESYFNQIPSTFDRDLSPAYPAIKFYQEIIDKYSTSDNIKKANENIKKAKEQLWKKEKYIADFYFKTDVYSAAKFRYLEIVRDYPENNELMKHAKFRAIISAKEALEFQECVTLIKKFENEISKNQTSKINRVYKDCLKSLENKIRNEEIAS